VLAHFLFFLSSLVFAQYHPQEWASITSLLSPTGIQVTSNNIVYLSTSGGLLKFDPTTEKFSAIKMEGGLVYLDLSTIEVDSKNRLWLGGSYPNGCLQVYEPDKGTVRKITHLDIAQISKIQIGEEIAFAVYEGATSTDIGILEFTLDSDGLPIYKDYFNNFSSDATITDISDLDILSDSIFVTTNVGIFSGNYKVDNLKTTTEWEQIFTGTSAKQFIPGAEPLIIFDSSIYRRENNLWIEYYDFPSEGTYYCEKKIDGDSIDCAIDLDCSDYSNPEDPTKKLDLGYCGKKIIRAEKDEGSVKLLFDNSYYELENGELTFSYENSVGNQDMEKNIIGGKMKTEFTCFTYMENGNKLFGLNNYGFLHMSAENNMSPIIFAPNTPFNNKYNAITVTSSGILAATTQLGSLVWDGEQYQNYIPSRYYTYYPSISNTVQFNYVSLLYNPGEQSPISILEKGSGHLLFCNSGSFPGYGTVIELDIITNQMNFYNEKNNIIDQDPTGYMMVNQIQKDRQKNIWVTNPYCENNGNMIAIQAKDDGSWSHVHVPDENSYRPQTIALDNANRSWVGFAYESLGDTLYSSGGIKVFQYANLKFLNETDSTWLTIRNPEMLPGGEKDASVWSLVFDKMEFLWILNEKGIRGYTYNVKDNEITLDPILRAIDGTPIDFLPQISYTKGNRIKVDSQNNKWISTHQGVWVIEESMAYWPSEVGLHPDNSGLLSDIVYDVAFDNDKGLAYLATDKGISILQIPFADNPSKKQSMYISPNPFIIPDDDWVIIKNIPSGSSIKIITITGSLIKEINLSSNESQAIWDGTDNQGNHVGTAVYLVSAHHPSKRNTVSKIAVIRK